MYADRVTDSMKAAIDEVGRRRKTQLAYNVTHNITPESITKPIRDRMVEKEEEEKPLQLESMTPQDKKKLITELTKDMRRASRDLDFETAARLRDEIARVT